MITKIIVSTTGFSKYLESISSNHDIDDEAEILMCLNSEYLSFPELGIREYPITYAVGFSTNNFQMRIEKSRIIGLIRLFNALSEQPATIHLSDNDNWIYLSGIGI